MTWLNHLLLASCALLAVACVTEAELLPIEDRAPAAHARPEHALDSTPSAPALSEEAAAAQGAECCDDAACPQPLECISYHGVAGPAGPLFRSCELPCGRETGGACPVGQTCVHISDGPGSVCAPVEPN